MHVSAIWTALHCSNAPQRAQRLWTSWLGAVQCGLSYCMMHLAVMHPRCKVHSWCTALHVQFKIFALKCPNLRNYEAVRKNDNSELLFEHFGTQLGRSGSTRPVHTLRISLWGALSVEFPRADCFIVSKSKWPAKWACTPYTQLASRLGHLQISC